MATKIEASLSGDLKMDRKNPAAPRKPHRGGLNWLHLMILTIPPALTLYGLLTVQLKLSTFIFAVVMYYLTGLSITAGYHRMWSHRAYKASFPFRFLLAMFGAGAYEGSILWWSRNHRAHHRYTDTDQDPYNVKRGFWWAHLGWMCVKQDLSKIGASDVSDLKADPLVSFQHKYYLPLAITWGVALPTAFAGIFFNDWAGGFFFACMARMVFVHHATFFVNSLAHTFGDRIYSDLHSAEDHIITALLSLGEGYHNFHHEFPQDYRNGIRFYHYDPTKWLISVGSLFGMTWGLLKHPEEEIQKAKLQMVEKHLDLQKKKLQYGPRLEDLPTMTMIEYRRKVAEGDQLIIINEIVHDVAPFVDSHPGGRLTLLHHVGEEDSTPLFNGKRTGTETVTPHVHDKIAMRFLNDLRIARIQRNNNNN